MNNVLSIVQLKALFAICLRFMLHPFPIAGHYFSLMEVWLFTSTFYIFINNISRMFGKVEHVDE